MPSKALLLALLMPMLTSAGTEVSFLFCYDPDHPEQPVTRRLLDYARRNPDVVPVKWGSLVLPGAGGRSTFMLSLAGGTAPDIYKAWFHILRHDIEQGFVYPLDEWADEAETFGRRDDLWDRVRRQDGHIWALPTPSVAYYGIVYRKDFVRAAGLDPERPPRTWTAFRAWCDKLTVPGRRAFAIENRPWGFLPWAQSAGGEVVRKGADGKFSASFDDPGCVLAAAFIKDLVVRGVVRPLPVLSVADDIAQAFTGGEIAAVFGGEDLVLRLTDTLDFPAEEIGLMPFPACGGWSPEGDGKGPDGQRVLQAHRHFYAMSESVGRRSAAEREVVWRCMRELASPELADAEVRRAVAEGRARWCRPQDLERLGFKEELARVPIGVREMYAALDAGEIRAVTEPWVGFWQGASDLLQRKLLGLLLSDAAARFDCAAALKAITDEANRGLMFEADQSGVERARPYARMILGAFAICLLVAVGLLWRHRRRTSETGRLPTGTAGGGRAWVFLAPAVLSIALWSYYPLLRGAVMAFQNYRIVGPAEWTGLDNFIRVATDPTFWTAWGRTLEYVSLTLVMGFVTPVVLAVMLCEIPRGKVLFRFLYFLPHLTSALVVTLLWKLMFDPTENGILNQILATLGIARHSWLQDPAWAMVCCILPGVWAGAGISSLIYIAALGSLPQDYYEAAALDGAGFLARLRHVTLPQLAPLMVINFVGAFIAAFQGMGSIFLLTFGGPGDATQVLSLSIWKEAYNNLRFSTATTMAWFLGIALIGFAYLQVRFLRRVEFRQAAVN